MTALARLHALGGRILWRTPGRFLLSTVLTEERLLPAIVMPDFLVPVFGSVQGEHSAWRYTLMSGLVPALPLILIRPFLPESPVWKQRKEAGTLRRLMTAPIPKASLLLGKLLGILLAGLLQMSVLILAGALLFGVKWGHAPLALGLLILSFGLAITSLSKDRAGAKRLLQISRRHWEIENRVHWVRDVTLGEDACRVRTGSAPAVLAGMRNACLRLLRSSGVTNVAEAMRRHAANPQQALELVRQFVPPDL